MLTLQFKRFSFSAFGKPTKLNKRISYPHYLTLDQYLSSNIKKDKNDKNKFECELHQCVKVQTESVKYRLYGVIVHDGSSLSSGHYYAFAQSPSQKWYRFDDTRVTEVTLDTVLNTHNAYVLFYVKHNPNSSNVQCESVTLCHSGTSIRAQNNTLCHLRTSHNRADDLNSQVLDTVRSDSNSIKQSNNMTQCDSMSSLSSRNNLSLSQRIPNSKRKLNEILDWDSSPSENSHLTSKRLKFNHDTITSTESTAVPTSLLTESKNQNMIMNQSLNKSKNETTSKSLPPSKLYYWLVMRRNGLQRIPEKIPLPSRWNLNLWTPKYQNSTISTESNSTQGPSSLSSSSSSLSLFSASSVTIVTTPSTAFSNDSLAFQQSSKTTTTFVSNVNDNRSHSSPIQPSPRAQLTNPRLVHAAKVLYNSNATTNNQEKKKPILDELCVDMTRLHQHANTPAWETSEAQNTKKQQTALLDHLHQTELQRRHRDPYDIEYDRGKLKKVFFLSLCCCVVSLFVPNTRNLVFRTSDSKAHRSVCNESNQQISTDPKSCH